jgi:hypothetical protein
MVSLLKDALGSSNLPSRGVPDVAGILVQGKDDRKASVIPNGRDLARVLQDIANCNASRIDEIYSDPTLAETFDIYSNNLNAATPLADDCQERSSTLLVCELPQSVDGETEYKNACTASGGQIESIPVDVKCEVSDTTNGQSATIYLDSPPYLFCVPPDDGCAEEIRDTFLGAIDDTFQSFEGLSAFGADISCQVTDEVPSSGADKNGIGFVSMTMAVVMSLIVGFQHHY